MEGPQVELSDIQRFYKNTTVFLTGATGFVGKLFLEKVLRALPVKRVYILVRAKKNVPAAKRFQDIFDSPAFDVLKRSHPEVLDKVIIMEGDISLPMVGLGEQDMETIVQEVNVIFHCAASVRFDEHLKKATRTNVAATKCLVDLAKRVKNLKTFVYVGTGYSNSNRSEIREEVYPAKITAENLIAACESLDDESVTSMTKTLIGDWPNTYTFTKQVAEEYINREGRDLPICIARPTVVTSTAEEPVSAFVDNLFTMAGFVMANAMGINRISYYKNINLDIVPADYVVNECIAAGWYTGDYTIHLEDFSPLWILWICAYARKILFSITCIGYIIQGVRTFKKHRTEIPVYHISSVVDNPICQDDIYTLCDSNCRKIPTTKLPVYPMYFTTTCKYNYLFLRFFFHTMVAYFIDLVLKIQGKKPIYLEGIKKLHAFQEAYEYFSTNEFFIHVDNTHRLLKKMTFRDRELFNFDIQSLNWENYFIQYTRGVRFYLVKDTMDTLPEGIKRYKYLKRVMIVTLVSATIFIYVLGKIFLFRVLPLVFGLLMYFLRGLIC